MPVHLQEYVSFLYDMVNGGRGVVIGHSKSLLLRKWSADTNQAIGLAQPLPSAPLPGAELAMQIREALEMDYPESWWQSFLKENLPAILPGYSGCIPKLNISAGRTRFPDFLLYTAEGYGDVLEIKKPSSLLLKTDKGRGIHYWSKEMSTAISQVGHYLETLREQGLRISAHLKTSCNLDLRVVAPKGIILAGDKRQFTTQGERDNFRLLSRATLNIEFITYDELPGFL